MQHLPPIPDDPWGLQVMAVACFGSFAVQYLARPFSKIAFGKPYTAMEESAKVDWDVRIVAIVHALLVAVGSTIIVADPDAAILNDPIFGFSPRAQTLYAISAGYFTWDIIVTVYYGWGAAYLGHALAAFCCYFFSLEPVFHGWGAVFLLYEWSTPWMHMRFMAITLKKTDTTFFSVIQGLFALTFVGVRIFWGLPMTYIWWGQTIAALQAGVQHSTTVFVIYLVSNTILTGLNVFWLFLMVKAFTKKHDPKNEKGDKGE